MRKGDFIEVHALVSYPAVLLNRDDTGNAKRISFGGASRTRVSSQAQKKAIRSAGAIGSNETLAVRSRRIFSDMVRPRLVESGLSEVVAGVVTEFLAREVAGFDKFDTERDPLRLGQVVVLSPSEVDWLVARGQEAAHALAESGEDATLENVKGAYRIPAARKKEMATLLVAPCVAAFGRFMTGDKLSNVDGSIGVAHALTTHSEISEPDYWSAVDTIGEDAGENEAGGLGEADLTTGVFYSYSAIDMNQLRRNVGSGEEAEEVVRGFIRGLTEVTPGAKKGSTAPYARAAFVLLERTTEQPRSLANSYLTAVPLGPRLMERSAEAMLAHRRDLDWMYGPRDGVATVSTIHRGVLLDDDPENMPVVTAIDHVLKG